MDRLSMNNKYLRILFDAIPQWILVVDKNSIIVDYNKHFINQIDKEPCEVIGKLGGVAVNCQVADNLHGACGTGVDCQVCVIRNSVKKAFEKQSVYREKAKMNIRVGDSYKEIFMLITASPFEIDKEIYTIVSVEDISILAELSSYIPICSGCKKIRNDKEFWESLEAYFEKNHELLFTHGMCPECVVKYFGEDL